MAVLESLNERISPELGNAKDKTNSEINVLVSNITVDILNEAPTLVADAGTGKVNSDVLETAIKKDMDKRKYFTGELSRKELIDRVMDYMFGYGPLQPYIENDDISDIDGTGYNEFSVTANGVRKPVEINFGSEELFERYCHLIAKRNYGILNENCPHCRVADEQYRLRINISIRPRNVSGPAISIRKHRIKNYSIDDLVRLGMMDEKMGEWTKKLAKTAAKIVFCGKGAAGKTTLLRAVVNEMPALERVMICEGDPEIYPDKPYCIEQRIKKKNEGGRIETLSDIVKDGLTMSLDTYIIGEAVSEETWDAVRAGHTGHRILLTTHSNSANDCLDRLLTLSMSSNLKESETTIKEMMGRSIDVIYHMDSFRVAEVIEVLGYDRAKDEFLTNRLFGFEIDSEDADGRIHGRFIKCSDIKDKLAAMFKRRGYI